MSNRPYIKLCGIKRLEDARYAAAVGADFLGFHFSAKHKRRVEPTWAAEIVSWIAGPTPVAVFLDDTVGDIVTICEQTGISLAQLDGHESPELCAELRSQNLGVIKSIDVSHDASLEQIEQLIAPFRADVDHIRLNVSNTSLFSSSGESLNWRVVRDLAASSRLFLAGQIDASNVESISESMRPFALDLCDSLEEEPGVMDFNKLGELFDIVNALDTQTG